jgi:hypothetical protein
VPVHGLKPVATEQSPLVGRKERPDPLTSAPDGAKAKTTAKGRATRSTG